MTKLDKVKNFRITDIFPHPTSARSYSLHRVCSNTLITPPLPNFSKYHFQIPLDSIIVRIPRLKSRLYYFEPQTEL